MLFDRLRVKAQGESGFTLVELLVVMLILGLLAAIAIPSFFNQRDKARDSDAKADVRTAQTAIETYATDHNGSYAGADPADLSAIESALSDAVADGELSVVVSGGGTGYEVTMASDNEPNTFTIERDGTTGQTSFGCSVDGSDGCPEGGNWGGQD